MLALLIGTLCNNKRRLSSDFFQKVLKNIKIICKPLFFNVFYFLCVCVSVSTQASGAQASNKTL